MNFKMLETNLKQLLHFDTFFNKGFNSLRLIGDINLFSTFSIPMKFQVLKIFLFSVLVSFAQGEMNLSTVEKIPLKAERFVGTDNFGSIYFIKNRTLHKKSTTENLEYKDFQLGTIGNVDILNPLRITVFYPQYQTAVILDNRLNEIRRISFAMEPPFLNVVNATTAADNRLWTFNENSQQLEAYNFRDKVNFTLSRPIAEKYITQQSNFNFCYVLTEKKLRVYNIYGSLINSIPAEGVRKISLSNDKIIVLKKEGLSLLTENLSVETAIKTPDLTIKDLYLIDDFLYIYDGEIIHKMKLTKTQN